MRYCKFFGLEDSLDPEAEIIQIQFIAGLRSSGTKLKILEALRANHNLTVEELLQLIQYRTQAKRLAESSVHQSTSSVVADEENCGLNKKKDLSCRQKPEQCPAKDEKCRNCSKQGHYSTKCKAKRQEASRTEGTTYRKSNASVYRT